MDNVTVVFQSGTHELKGSLFLREVNDFTLLGAGGINGESHVEVNCKGVSSLLFDTIINLTITKITFSQCGTLYQYEDLGLPLEAPRINALTFSNVFDLRLMWVEIEKSVNTAILAVNVLGSSVIDNSVFQSFSDSQFQRKYYTSHRIYIAYENCNQIQYNSRRCSNKTKSLLHAMNSHKLCIHNCVLRYGSSGSMTVDFNQVGYKVELDLMNISVLNGAWWNVQDRFIYLHRK